MTKRICSFFVIMELAAVMLLASIWSAQTSPIWECVSGGGWSMASDGSMTEIPASEVLNDNESVLTVIFEAGPQAAMVKTSKCERVQ